MNSSSVRAISVLRFFQFGILAGAMWGCSGAEMSTVEGNPNEGVGTVHQEVVGTWVPGTLPSRNVKIARNPTLSPYEWDDGGNPNSGSGHVCHGLAGSVSFFVVPEPCGTYILPSLYLNRDIRAIAIAQNTSHVYTWYSNNTVSEGTSTDLAHYNGPIPFSRSTIPSTMSLIDADVSPNGQVYYYWRDTSDANSTTNVHRSVGTSTNAGTFTLLPAVKVADDTLISISFTASGPIEAWYASGQWRRSSDSMDLQH